MKNFSKKFQLVLVKWEDSRQPKPEWQFVDDIQSPSPVSCASVGWVVHQDKSVLSLAPNIGDVDLDEEDSYTQVSGVIEIPISCVKSISVLEESGE